MRNILLIFIYFMMLSVSQNGYNVMYDDLQTMNGKECGKKRLRPILGTIPAST
jgi:hypothetical protein